MAVTGLKQTIEAFKRLEKDIQDDVLDAVEETTLLIQRQAISNAPAAGDQVATTYGTKKNTDPINQYIFSEFRNQGLTGTVGIERNATEMAIYLEFGTGVSAAGYVPTLPKEFQEVARKYYINGLGKIIKHPFLLPAYFQHSPELVKKIKTILKNVKF